MLTLFSQILKAKKSKHARFVLFRKPGFQMTNPKISSYPGFSRTCFFCLGRHSEENGKGFQIFIPNSILYIQVGWLGKAESK